MILKNRKVLLGLDTFYIEFHRTENNMHTL